MKLNWGKSILIFILLFLSLCTVVIIFSLRQNNDLVSDDYYNEGADYNTKLAVINRSIIYLDSIQLMQHSDRIVIRLADVISTDDNKLALWFYRPSGKNSDLKSEFTLAGDSVIVDRDKLLRGRYILKISWLDEELDYTIEKDIFIN